MKFEFYGSETLWKETHMKNYLGNVGKKFSLEEPLGLTLIDGQDSQLSEDKKLSFKKTESPGRSMRKYLDSTTIVLPPHLFTLRTR